MLNTFTPLLAGVPPVAEPSWRRPMPWVLTVWSASGTGGREAHQVSGKIHAEIRLIRSDLEPEVEAFLNIQRTAELHIGQLTQLLRPHGLSPAQYNVLRILRGAGTRGLPCGEIATRMISRDPDITRLIDRMEQRGWVARTRSTLDRRVVTVTAMAPALEILEQLDAPVSALHKSQFAVLDAERILTLISLLEELR